MSALLGLRVVLRAAPSLYSIFGKVEYVLLGGSMVIIAMPSNQIK